MQVWKASFLELSHFGEHIQEANTQHERAVKVSWRCGQFVHQMQHTIKRNATQYRPSSASGKAGHCYRRQGHVE